MDGDRELHRTRDAVLAGGRPRAAPRSEIAASWRRVSAGGLAPGAEPAVPPLPSDQVEARRVGSELAPLLPLLTSALSCAVDDGQLVVVADTDGRVLWRRGSTAVKRHADSLGFVGGSAWTEGNVGTNAIGTSLVTGEPVQIRGAEHYVQSHVPWGCAAAPVRDPWTGRTLGVVDVSAPSRRLHPAELSLVALAAQVSVNQLLEHRRAALDRLRAHAAPVLARTGGRALAVDPDGHLAAATGLEAPDRVALPRELATLGPGRVWLPSLGTALAEPLPGGWLLRLDADGLQPATRLELDLVGRASATLTGPTGTWSHDLSPRHAEILVALVVAGHAGRTAAQLADDLFGDPGRVVTVRAEVSRLRRVLAGQVLARPYRLTPGLQASMVLPRERAALLPESSAPVVAALRH